MESRRQSRPDLTSPYAENAGPAPFPEHDQRGLPQKKRRPSPLSGGVGAYSCLIHTSRRERPLLVVLLHVSLLTRAAEMTLLVRDLPSRRSVSAMAGFRPSGIRRLGTSLRSQCRSRGALHPVPLKPLPDPWGSLRQAATQHLRTFLLNWPAAHAAAYHYTVSLDGCQQGNAEMRQASPRPAARSIAADGRCDVIRQRALIAAAILLLQLCTGLPDQLRLLHRAYRRQRHGLRSAQHPLHADA